MKRVSVILPIYNESGLISLVFNKVRDFAKTQDQFDFLFVDDGSTDATVEILRGCIKRDGVGDRIRLHCLKMNAGKGCAVREGVLCCDSEYVCFTDGDLAYSLDHLLRLRDALECCDMVIGSRNLLPTCRRNISLHRKIMGKGFNFVVRLVLGLSCQDTQAGLKGFRLDVAKKIFAHQRVDGFAFDAELIFLAKRFGFKVGEVAASVSKGHSYKVTKMNLLRDPFRMFGSLLDVRLNSILGKYAHENSAEFRRGGVRHSAGIRSVDS